MTASGIQADLAPALLTVLRDTDYRRMAGEYLEDFQRLAPPDVVAYNIHAHRLYEAAAEGRWGQVANTLDRLCESAEEFYGRQKIS